MGIFIIWIVLSLFAGMLGTDKTIGFWGAFFLSLLLSPVIGFIIVICSSSKPEPPPPVQPQLNTGIAEEITKFKKLLDDGIITQAEYDQQRNKLLGN